MENKEVLATAIHPVEKTEIVIYKQTWSDHATESHSELQDCGHKHDCLEEVVKTLNNPSIIREGRNPSTEELFIRYTEQVEFGIYRGFSVSTRNNGSVTFMTTAYYDVISSTKGKVKYKKGQNSE